MATVRFNIIHSPFPKRSLQFVDMRFVLSRSVFSPQAEALQGSLQELRTLA
jgi:hypothetical protein